MEREAGKPAHCADSRWTEFQLQRRGGEELPLQVRKEMSSVLQG